MYEALISSELEELATRHPEKSQLDETLELLTMGPQIDRRIGALDGYTVFRARERNRVRPPLPRNASSLTFHSVILGSRILVALRQKEQEEKIGVLLARMRIITEANLEDARQLLQVFHEQFAVRIAEGVHVVMFSCVENVSPVPNWLTLKVCDSRHSNVAILTSLETQFLLSEVEVAQLMGRIDEHLQGGLDDLSHDLAQDLDSGLGPLTTRELSVLAHRPGNYSMNPCYSFARTPSS